MVIKKLQAFVHQCKHFIKLFLYGKVGIIDLNRIWSLYKRRILSVRVYVVPVLNIA